MTVTGFAADSRPENPRAYAPGKEPGVTARGDDRDHQPLLSDLPPSYHTVVITGNYTVQPNDEVILADNPGGASVSVTLPDATSCPGRLITLASFAFSGGGVLTSVPVGGQRVVNSPNPFEVTQVSLISDGSNWWMTY